MQGPQPPTQFELEMLESFKIMQEVRSRMTMIHEGTIRCIDKCMDKDELYLLNRPKMPISERLKLDEKERKCVGNCAAKWDSFFQREFQRLMRTEQDNANFELMMQIQKAQQEMLGIGSGK